MRLVFFLIAAFCRLAKSLSHSELMGWLVGAVGIEPTSETWEECANSLFLPVTSHGRLGARVNGLRTVRARGLPRHERGLPSLPIKRWSPRLK